MWALPGLYCVARIALDGSGLGCDQARMGSVSTVYLSFKVFYRRYVSILKGFGLSAVFVVEADVCGGDVAV